MSSRAAPKTPATKAAPKTPAAKAAAPAIKAKAAPAKDVVPSANDIAESPAAPVAAGAEQLAEKKTRQQLTNILHINISQARCQTHLKQNLGDEEIEGEIKELRKELKAAKDAKDSEKEKATKAKIAELSKTLVRISSETPIAAAVVCDILVKELLRRGMDQAMASDRKIVEVGHYHDGDPSTMLCFPIVNKLPSFAGYDPEREEELRKERAAANKATKEAREAKKAAAEEKKGGAKAAPKAAKAEEEEVDGEGDESEHTKTTFFTYVENALKTVKKDAPYSTMRVSNRVREDLSEIVAEAIARLATLSRIVVQRVMKVRTMNADHIKAVVHMLMADEGRTEEQISEITKQIDEKLEVYHGHLKSEKDKKAAALDEEKKAEIERKKLEADLLRKKKQAELAKKRAIEAAQKAKDLTAETAKLEPVVAANLAAAKAKTEAETAAKTEETSSAVDALLQ